MKTPFLGFVAIPFLLILAAGPARSSVTNYAIYEFEGTVGGAASVVDVSGNGRNYVNSLGGNTYNATVRPGSAGGTSIQFANGGFYDMANIPGNLLPTNNVGLEGWFKASNASEANVHIFGLGGNNAGMSIAQNGAYWLGLHGGVKWLTQTQVPVDTSQWIHLAIVRDNGTTKFYANGQFTGSDSGALSLPAGSPHLAVNNGGSVRYDGLADDLRIFTFGTGEFRMYDSAYFTGANQDLAYGKASRSNGSGMNLNNNYTNPNWGSDGTTLNDSTGNFVEMPFGSSGVFFETELGTRAQVSAINILPRSGFDRRLENIQVSVFNGATETVIGTFNTNGNPTGSLRITGLDVTAERVRITKIGPTTSDGAPNTLNLSELEVLGTSIVSSNIPAGRLNVASIRNNPMATAAQSSTYGGDGQNPAAVRAIDGITDGAYANGSLTHTDDTGTPAWWQVSLGASFTVDEVSLFNRDGFQDRLGNFRVSILNGGSETYGFDQIAAIGTAQTYSFAPVQGDTVRVQMLGQNPAGNNILSLAEVQVMQVPEPSVLLLLAAGGLIALRRRRGRMAR